MKAFAIIFLLLTTSCIEIAENISCKPISYQEQEIAKSLYGDMFASRVSLTYEEGRKIFGCNYSVGDYVYTYSRLYDEGYVLVRDNNAITYREKSK